MHVLLLLITVDSFYLFRDHELDISYVTSHFSLNGFSHTDDYEIQTGCTVPCGLSLLPYPPAKH